MAKQSINLLITKHPASGMVRRMQKISPMFAGISLVVFCAAFIISFEQLRASGAEHDRVRKEITDVEKSILTQQSAEGLYTLTAKSLDVLQRITDKNITFNRVLSELSTLQSESTIFANAHVDDTGVVSISIISESYTYLNEFVSNLLAKESEGLFSNIKTQGVVRDRDGEYRLSISFVVDQSLLL